MEIRRGDTCKRKKRERERKVECASRGERTKLKNMWCVCAYIIAHDMIRINYYFSFNDIKSHHCLSSKFYSSSFVAMFCIVHMYQFRVYAVHQH